MYSKVSAYRFAWLIFYKYTNYKIYAILLQQFGITVMDIFINKKTVINFVSALFFYIFTPYFTVLQIKKVWDIYSSSSEMDLLLVDLI